MVVAVDEPDQLINNQPVSGVAVKWTTSPELYSSSVFAVLVTSCDTDPCPTKPTLSVYCILLKVAVIVLSPVIITVSGFVLPDTSPDQLVNSYPASAVAVIETLEFSS